MWNLSFVETYADCLPLLFLLDNLRYNNFDQYRGQYGVQICLKIIIDTYIGQTEVNYGTKT